MTSLAVTSAAVAALALAACSAGKGNVAVDAASSRAQAAPDAASPAQDAPSERSGCGTSRLLAAPEDFAAPGPWPVGVRTLELAGLRAEVWYPARPGSQAGAAKVAYDLAEELPPADAARLAAVGVTLPRVPCACFRDLPVDDAHGPYPLVLYVHGLSLVRFEAVTLTAHWASRGFVVIAADFPGARFADLLTDAPRARIGDVAAGAARLLDAFDAAAFHVDATRLGLTGHSLGADVASRLAATRGDVVIAMAERGVAPARRSFSTLVLGGMDDRVEPFVRQERGYASSPAPKRLVGIARAGHMSFSDVCSVAPGEGGLYAVAHAAGVPMHGFLAALADRGCTQIELPPERAWRVIRFATSAALEEVLHCRGEATAALAHLAELPDVGTLSLSTR